MKPIAIIPARGGSKRIPKKNIKQFNGKPIIYYPINELINSNFFEDVYVSTDDPDIAEIAKEYGAKVPWLRSIDLANDYTKTIEVIRSEVVKMNLNSESGINICCVYPTTPFLRSSDIQKGLQLLESGAWDYVISAVKVNYSPQRTFELESNRRVKMHFNNFEVTRTQDLTPSYRDAGQFYWGSVSSWESSLPLFSSKSTIIELMDTNSIDIDTLEDWERAETWFRLEVRKT
jgi:N-acylneuraminate cytidylyltransferase